MKNTKNEELYAQFQKFLELGKGGKAESKPRVPKEPRLIECGSGIKLVQEGYPPIIIWKTDVEGFKRRIKEVEALLGKL